VDTEAEMGCYEDEEVIEASGSMDEVGEANNI
jgi:hypothetical protein